MLQVAVLSVVSIHLFPAAERTARRAAQKKNI